MAIPSGAIDGWRVPTLQELTVLCDAGYSDWIQRNNVYGRFFGTAPNRVLLPTAGWRCTWNGALSEVGWGGFYWGSTPSGTGSVLDLEAV